MGSKSRIAKDIVPIIQNYIDKIGAKLYVEPFVGGANIIDKICCETKIGADINKYLIALLRKAQSSPEELFEEVSRELYNKARNEYNSGGTLFEDWEIGNIGFLASYNGRFFDGGYAQPGYEKTRNGFRFRDYYQEAKNNLLKQADNLKDCLFLCGDYRGEYDYYYDGNAVIYADPPYKNTKKFSNATDFDYEEFWNMMSNLSKENVVLVSELEAPDDWICIWEKQVSRSIKATDKSVATEKLFIHRRYLEQEVRNDG